MPDGQDGLDLRFDPSWETGAGRRAVARLLRNRLAVQVLLSIGILASVFALDRVPGPASRLILAALRYSVSLDYDFAGLGAKALGYLQGLTSGGDEGVPASTASGARAGGEVSPSAPAARAPAGDGTLPGRLPGAVPESAATAPGAADASTGVTAPPPSMTPPVAGRVLSWFGWRIGPDGKEEYHRGIDIAAPQGTPVRAAAAGVVRKAGEEAEYGKYVIIDHGGGWETLYAHNSRVAVSEGMAVRKGQVIAYVGKTGNATVAHLHFEVRANGREKDPAGHIGLVAGE